MIKLIIIVVAALQYLQWAFEGDMAFYVGWLVQDLTILVMMALAIIGVKSRIDQAILIVFFFWSFHALLWNTAYISDIPVYAQSVIDLTTAIIFIPWFIKQLFVIDRPPSDTLNRTHYFYLLAPVKSWTGIINLLRPSVSVAYGARAVYGNGKLWIVRNGVFKKLYIDHPKGDFVFVNSGIPISNVIDSRLNALLNRRMVPFFLDCAKLSLGKSAREVINGRR